VCVKECPTEHFAFFRSIGNSIPDWKERMICRYGESVTSEDDAEVKININQCARYYLRSRPGESTVTTFSVRIFH
jgi:hypothetical protein